MLQTFSLALLGAATTSSHQIFPSTCSYSDVAIVKISFFCIIFGKDDYCFCVAG